MHRQDNCLPRNHNLFKRDLKKYEKAELLADLINTNWPEILSVELANPTHSYEIFNKKINELLDTRVPLERSTKKNYASKQSHGSHLVLLNLLKEEICY